MKARSDQKEIDGVRFATTTLPPMRGFVLEPKILRIVAPIIAAGGLDQLAMTDLVEGFLRYSDAERSQLSIDILAGTAAIVDGERIELTSEKELNRALPEANTIWPLLWWVIGFNFFPTGLGALLANSAAAATASPSTSQT